MTRRALPPFQRDLFFLLIGGGWGTYTVITAGPWPLMLISAATMLGPGFMRLWLLRPGTALNPGSQSEAPSELSASSSSGSSE